MKLHILYEDERFILVHKPIKVLSHQTKGNELDDVLNLLHHPEYHVITRLDTNTEGIMLIAKDKESSSLLNQLSMNHLIKKTYLALCTGYFEKSEDILTAYLVKDSNQGIVRLSSEALPGLKEIKTKYKVLQEKNLLSLVEVELLTGKTHQIRAHMNFIGHPLLGDTLYGNPRLNQKFGLKTQALISYQISFHDIEESHPLYYLNNKSWKTSSQIFSKYI